MTSGDEYIWPPPGVDDYESPPVLHFAVYPLNEYGQRLHARPACGAPRDRSHMAADVTCPDCRQLRARMAHTGEV